MPPYKKPAENNYGFTLPELLVSLTLLSLLSLGFIASYFHARQSAQDGFYRARAMAIATDLIKRIQLNGKDNAALATYLQLLQELPEPSDNQPDFNCQNPANPCSPVQIATNDVTEINYYLHQSLPKADLHMQACDHNLCLKLTWLELQPDQCRNQTSNCLFIKFRIPY